MKLNVYLVAMFLGLAHTSQSQMRFTLREAQDYAADNSFSAQRAELDVRAAKAKVLETTAIGLPQISAEGSYNHNVQIPTSVVPGEFFGAPPGTFIPVRFGVRHSMTGGLTGTQLLFNGSYIVGLQASMAYKRLSEQNRTKTKIEVRQEVANAYYLVLAASENVSMLEKALSVVKELSVATRALYENGLSDEQSADQIDLSKATLENNLEYAKLQGEQALDLLRFTMGLPQGTAIELSDNLNQLITNASATAMINGNSEATIDYQIAKNVVQLQRLNLKNTQAAYLPTVALFATHQQNGFANELDRFQWNRFFPASIIGFKISMPILTSGMQHQKVQQARLEFKKAQLQETQAREGIALQQQNARNSYNFQLRNYQNQKANLALAERVKNKTMIQFKEGIASSFDYSQAENQYIQAQGAYIQAIINLLNAQTEYLKAFNQLN